MGEGGHGGGGKEVLEGGHHFSASCQLRYCLIFGKRLGATNINGVNVPSP